MPVILIGNVSEEEMRRRVEFVGADAFLLKTSVDPSTLNALLEQLIDANGPDRTDLPASVRGQVAFLVEAEAIRAEHEATRAYYLAMIARSALAEGGRCIDAVAKHLGLTRNALSPFALLAARWTVDELRELLVFRRTAKGHRLSVSHLVELGRLSGVTRAQLLARALMEDLTVRQLRVAIAELERQR
jgi:hypothetical protein